MLPAGKRMIQFGFPGSPDIIAIVRGYFLGIEVKGPKGKQRESQAAFEQNVKYSGGYYVLAYSVEDVEEALLLIPKL